MTNLEKYKKLVSERDARIKEIEIEYEPQLNQLQHPFTLDELLANGWKYKCWYGFNYQDLYEKNGTLLLLEHYENNESKIKNLYRMHNEWKEKIIDMEDLEIYYKTNQNFRGLNIKKVTQL